MGKEWDKDKGGRDNWIAWMRGIAKECLRVLKPGGHALVWSLPRTSHWTATAWEDAGFEIRDRIAHVFGSGFPKSLNIGKAIDRAAGAEREVVGESRRHTSKTGGSGNSYVLKGDLVNGKTSLTAPATDAAKQWDGWGTGLKPAVEDWWLLRKPISEKSIAANVLKWGTGGLNIDGCRVGTNPGYRYNSDRNGTIFHGKQGERIKQTALKRDNKTIESTQGRYPAHLILDDSAEVEACFPKTMSGKYKHNSEVKRTKPDEYFVGKKSDFTKNSPANYGDGGSAARYFKRIAYFPKASRKDRNEGLEKLTDKDPHTTYAGDEWSRNNLGNTPCNKRKLVKNNHPTVKSTPLMQYLCRLITPPNGLICDPFCGSGSTGKAAMIEGFRFIGIDTEREYCAIAKARIEAAGMKQNLF